MAECRTLVVDLDVPGLLGPLAAYACCNAMFFIRAGQLVTDRIVNFCD